MSEAFHSGFIAIVGRPNVGKSTLLNKLLGEKIVAVSDKPQTTRTAIRGIISDENSQLVFVDTPGIHTARTRINRAMVDAAMTTLGGVDLILLVVDAQSGSNCQRLVELARARMPQGVAFFPDDILTDQPEKQVVAEMIREKVFRMTSKEVPYGTAVLVDSFQERESGLIAIMATIMVERDTHKGIVIGKRGSMLKKIGEQARRDIERLLGTRVYLELFVQVQERWTERTAMLRELGYE